MRNRQKGGSPPAAATQPTPGSLAAGAADFLEHLAARAYSKGSIEAHQWALKGFLEWADSLDFTSPGSFTRATIESYQFHLHHYRSPRTKEPLGVNTQLGRLGCVRRFFAWLCRSGTLPANPAADLDLPRKQSRRLPKALSPEELDRLFSLPNPADPMGLRDRTILELFYATGIRRTEMTQLDPGDYDPDTQTLLIRHGKNDKSRLLPVGGRAAFWLDRFLSESRPLFDHLPNETALFLSGYGTRITPAYLGTWVAGQMKKAGITKPGACHLLRHSMATDMHLNGADIRFVQEMLGHARLETTQIYTHVNIKALAEVHARTHPHGTLPKDHEHGYREPEPSEPPAPEPPPDIPPDPGPPPQPDAPLKTNPPAPADCPGDSPCGTGEAVLGVPSAMQATHLQPCPTHPAVPKPPGPDENPTDSGPEPPSDHPTRPNPPNPLNPFTSNALQQSDPAAEGGHVAFYGYRWYDPLTGRWTSREPIGERGGINLYAFDFNSPVHLIDRLGLEPILPGPGQKRPETWEELVNRSTAEEELDARNQGTDRREEHLWKRIRARELDQLKVTMRPGPQEGCDCGSLKFRTASKVFEPGLFPDSDPGDWIAGKAGDEMTKFDDIQTLDFKRGYEARVFGSTCKRLSLTGEISQQPGDTSANLGKVNFSGTPTVSGGISDKDGQFFNMSSAGQENILNVASLTPYDLITTAHGARAQHERQAVIRFTVKGFMNGPHICCEKTYWVRTLKQPHK